MPNKKNLVALKITAIPLEFNLITLLLLLHVFFSRQQKRAEKWRIEDVRILLHMLIYVYICSYYIQCI